MSVRLGDDYAAVTLHVPVSARALVILPVLVSVQRGIDVGRGKLAIHAERRYGRTFAESHEHEPERQYAPPTLYLSVHLCLICIL